jgi:agmatine deiminase
LRQELSQLFQVQDCLIIPKEPYDPIGHVDGIVRFLDDSTVLVNDYSAIDKDYGRRLRSLLRKHRLDYEEIPYSIEQKTEDGIPSAAGCYINYLRTEKLIVLPTFGTKKDEEVLRRVESLFRGTTVVPLRCEEMARRGGVLNCCTWSSQSI